jgi:hypothetical protein
MSSEIDTRAEELAKRAERLQDKVSASSAVIDEIEFDIKHIMPLTQIYFVIDFNILFSYLFPFLDLKEQLRRQFLFSQFVLQFIVESAEIKKVIIGPYASEYKRFFEENRRRILDSQIDDASRRALKDFLCDRYFAFRLLSKNLQSARRTEDEISHVLIKHFSSILQRADNRFWSLINDKRFLSLRDCVGDAEVPTPDTQSYQSEAFLKKIEELRPDTPTNNRKDAAAVLLVDKLNHNYRRSSGTGRCFALLTEDNILVEALDRTDITIVPKTSTDHTSRGIRTSRNLFHFFLIFSFARGKWNEEHTSRSIKEFAKQLTDYKRLVHRLYIERLTAKWGNAQPSGDLLVEADNIFTNLEAVLNQIDNSPTFREGVIRLLGHFEQTIDELISGDPVPDTIEKAIALVAESADMIHTDIDQAISGFSTTIRRLEILIARLGVPKNERHAGFYYPSVIVGNTSDHLDQLRVIADDLDKRATDDIAKALDALLNLGVESHVQADPNYHALLSKAYRVQSLSDESLDVLRHSENSVATPNAELIFERALTLRSIRPEAAGNLQSALELCLKANELAQESDPRILRELGFLYYRISEDKSQTLGANKRLSIIQNSFDCIVHALKIFESNEELKHGHLRSLYAHLHNDFAYLSYTMNGNQWDILIEALHAVDNALLILDGLILEKKYRIEETNKVVETRARILLAMWKIRVSTGYLNPRLLSEISRAIEKCRLCNAEAKCVFDLERDFPAMIASMPTDLILDNLDPFNIHK